MLLKARIDCPSHLLRGNIKCDSPEVNLLVGVNAGQDEEYSRSLRTPGTESSKAEYDGPLVLLDHLNNKTFSKYFQSGELEDFFIVLLKKNIQETR